MARDLAAIPNQKSAPVRTAALARPTPDGAAARRSPRQEQADGPRRSWRVAGLALAALARPPPLALRRQALRPAKARARRPFPVRLRQRQLHRRRASPNPRCRPRAGRRGPLARERDARRRPGGRVATAPGAFASGPRAAPRSTPSRRARPTSCLAARGTSGAGRRAPRGDARRRRGALPGLPPARGARFCASIAAGPARGPRAHGRAARERARSRADPWRALGGCNAVAPPDRDALAYAQRAVPRTVLRGAYGALGEPRSGPRAGDDVAPLLSCFSDDTLPPETVETLVASAGAAGPRRHETRAALGRLQGRAPAAALAAATARGQAPRVARGPRLRRGLLLAVADARAPRGRRSPPRSSRGRRPAATRAAGWRLAGRC